MATKERWTTTTAPRDFDAAADYLSLLFDSVTVIGRGAPAARRDDDHQEGLLADLPPPRVTTVPGPARKTVRSRR